MFNNPPNRLVCLSAYFALFILVFQFSVAIVLGNITTDTDAEISKTEVTFQTANGLDNTVKISKAKISSSSLNSQISESALRDIEDLTPIVKSLVSNDLFNNITKIGGQLETDAVYLESLRDVPCSENLSEDEKKTCLANKNKLNLQIKKLRDKKTILDKNTQELQQALTTTYQNIQTLADSLSGNLTKLKELSESSTSSELLKILPIELPRLQNAISLHRRFSEDWKVLSDPFIKLGMNGNEQIISSLKISEETSNSIKGKLAQWFQTLTNDANAQSEKLDDLWIKLIKNLGGDFSEGIREANKLESSASILGQIIEIGDGLKNTVTDENFAKNIDLAEEAKNKQLNSIARLRSSAIGDFDKFEGDYVPLYYFTDVPNLMRILNPNMYEVRDKLGLRELAEQKRREMNESDIMLSNAQADVNDLQIRVRQLREQLDNAQRAAESSAGLLARAQKRFDGIGADDTAKKEAAKQQRDNRKAENDAAKANLEKLQDENNGLPAKISTAEANLLEAQQTVRKKRTALLLLAQAESDAFANAVGAERVYVAPIIPGSPDPLQNVYIYSFGDRKVVYLRGTRKNINQAKKTIALLDRPAPQARMTLWTFELNGEATTRGSIQFNKSLEIIEKELSDTRLNIAATLSLFRDAVNQEVSRVANQVITDDERNNRKLSRNNHRDLRWARLHFYQNEVLLRFGIDTTCVDNRYNQLYLSSIALPDPAGSSTLGEALIILTLASADSRSKILNDFQTRVRTSLNINEVVEKKKNKNYTEQHLFPALKRIMGGDLQTSSDFLTPTQKEIVETLLSATRPRILNRIKARLKLYEEFTTYKKRALDEIEKEANVTKTILNDADKSSLDGTITESHKTLEKLSVGQSLQDIKLLEFLSQWLWREANLEPNEAVTDEFTKIKKNTDELKSLVTKIEKGDISQNPTDDKDKKSAELKGQVLGSVLQIKSEIKFLENRFNREQSLNTATAKVARVDFLLKQMIDAMDEDINRNFVQKMMVNLRNDLVKNKGISLGIVDRVSILSTNRLLARVDGRSSAQLEVGEEQNILQSVKQLTDVYLATKAGGYFGALNSLSGLPNKDVSEIYGLTNGSLFKVTPIFDPTGQTLRFRFDYSTSNLVQEPNGTINPQLPRIERHTVNTEVELNNMELREISRFNTNARLGIPTKKTGGIPLIKDIPQMDRIPLLGWFTRRAGKSAVIQESLIFGQTTMYPTIGDLFELLHGADYEDADKFDDNQDK